MPIINEPNNIQTTLETKILRENIISHRYLHNLTYCVNHIFNPQISDLNYTYLVKWSAFLNKKGRKEWNNYINMTFISFNHMTKMGELIAAIKNRQIIHQNYLALIKATELLNAIANLRANQYMLINNYEVEMNNLLLKYMDEGLDMEQRLLAISRTTHHNIYTPTATEINALTKLTKKDSHNN